MKNRPTNDEVLARLDRFSKLERKCTDEEGWIAKAYSCTLIQALRLIEKARKSLEEKS